MKSLFKALFASALMLIAVPASLAATNPPEQVAVSFQNPEGFTDFAVSKHPTERQDRQMQALFSDYLRSEAKKVIPDGSRLEVSFLDIDLAGYIEVCEFDDTREWRVLHRRFKPRMELSFRLTTSSGEVLKEGRRVLTDHAYKPSASRVSLAEDRYLLRDWLTSEFKQHSPSQ